MSFSGWITHDNDEAIYAVKEKMAAGFKFADRRVGGIYAHVTVVGGWGGGGVVVGWWRTKAKRRKLK